MKTLRNSPIQRKLRFVILLTCTAALCVACTALFLLQTFLFKREFRRDVVAVAEVIADTSIGPISFNRPDGALDIIVQVIKSKPQITSATIVLNDGTLFAEFGGSTGASPPYTTRIQGFVEDNGDLNYVEPIIDEGERLGTLYIHSAYRQQLHQLRGLYLLILTLVLATSFLVAIFVSTRLEHFVTEPIRTLANTAREIANKADYALRAHRFGDDEVGAFTDTFNGMLDQIQSRDQALRHEIAERARAETEIQQIHQQLMEASRQAGMAEVATGVLHNVGNVLNSVNVSATLITERLAHSRAGNLARAANLLRERTPALAEFLSHDPKGRMLPGYLADVSEQVVRERDEVLAELELLDKNIEHIKDIVATQQSYARISGLIEPMAMEALVEDALRMNANSLEHHGISIERAFSKSAPAAVDKHKVLQILVNVLRNAKNAILEGGSGERRILISLRQKDPATIELSVTDTGCGIPAENLTRIFSHGFTTRKDGHGFGLHSAALAAQQMGGRLHAESPGPGQGACFTLELPAARTEPIPPTPTP